MDLIIDTSSENLLVLLNNQKQVYKNEPTNSKHLENLLPQIDFVLNKAKIDLSQIETFGVVVGPGSFTGVRIGVCTIKAFMQNSKAKLVAIDMLELLNYVILKRKLAKKDYCILIKSTSTKYYALFCNKNGDIDAKQMTTLTEVSNQKNQIFTYNNCLKGKIDDIENVDLKDTDYIEYLESLKKDKSFVLESDLKPVYMAMCQAEEELIKKENQKNVKDN